MRAPRVREQLPIRPTALHAGTPSPTSQVGKLRLGVGGLLKLPREDGPRVLFSHPACRPALG